jgi:uncharacterized membrane protein YhaH (DUF805 family)
MFGKFASQVFTFRGRSSRANFWLTLLLGALAYTGTLFAILAVFAGSNPPFDLNLAGLFLALLNWAAFIVIYVFAAIRRLHDRNKSGHWMWLFAFAPAILNIVGAALDQLGNAPILVLISVAAAAGLLLWGIIELGFLRSAAGPNRFGPDPLAAYPT